MPETNKYRVIYADPPWRFTVRSDKGKGRSAEAHYDCLSLAEIKAMDVQKHAAADCVLLMWTTDPMLAEAMDVIKAWNFTYKTVGFYWVKSYSHIPLVNAVEPSEWPLGTGYWTRANPEQCLLATRGSPKRINADVRKLIVAPRREHSRKPDQVYDRIERLVDGPYLELFARNRRQGWDSLGDEVDKGIATRRWKSTGGPQPTAEI